MAPIASQCHETPAPLLGVANSSPLIVVPNLHLVQQQTRQSGRNPGTHCQATETVRRDTKAVVEGVKEGMRSDNKAININKASREDMLTLPGITDHEADRIIAGRPFDDAHDLVNRHIVSQAEYDKISNRVIAGH